MNDTGSGMCVVTMQREGPRVLDLRRRMSSCDASASASPPGSNTRHAGRTVDCTCRSRCMKLLPNEGVPRGVAAVFVLAPKLVHVGGKGLRNIEMWCQNDDCGGDETERKVEMSRIKTG